MQIIVDAKLIAKDARPMTNIRPINLKSGAMPEIFSLNKVFFEKRKYPSTKIAAAPCPSIVAKALPATPQPRLRTKIQFSATHTTTLTALVSKANFGLPAVRIKLFIPMPIDKNKNP